MCRFARVVMAGLLTLVVGCRINPNQQLLERELRLQEDTIYQLQGVIDEIEQQVESCRRENSALRQSGGGALKDSVIEPTPETHGPPEGFKPPVIDLGPETDRSSVPSDQTQTEPSAGPRLSDGPGHNHADQVNQIAINPRLTGGNNADGAPGDEGLMVVFEPRDAKNRLVNIPGTVSLIVEDPAAAAPGVARWNFTTDEVAARFRNSVLGRGFQFELPWPNQPPANKKLHLRVIYRLASGRSFTADHRFEVDLMPVGTRSEPRLNQPPTDVSASRGVRSPTAPRVASQRQREPEAKVADVAKPTPEPAPAFKTRVVKAQPIEIPAVEGRSARRPRWSPTRN